MIRRLRAFLGKLAGATPTATRVEELRPLRWSVVDDYGHRWLLVQTAQRFGDDGGTLVLTLQRDELPPRITP